MKVLFYFQVFCHTLNVFASTVSKNKGKSIEILR